MTIRDHSIDAIRGIAIFVMIFANAAPEILPQPHAFYFRAIDSYAAPVFIALAGFGISFALRNASPILFHKKLVFRGLLTILVAALIDVFVWGIMPFVTFDVLYLIGFGVLLASVFGKIPNVILLISVMLIVGISFYVQESGFYQAKIPNVPLSSKLSEVLHHGNAFAISGWFPIFPWLAFFILGYLGGRKKPRFGRSKLLYTFAFFAVFNYTLFYIYYQSKITREGYSELFYPADIFFVLNAAALLLMIWMHRPVLKSATFSIFRMLGKCSLFLYIFHAVFIRFFLESAHELANQNHWITYLMFYVVIFALAFALNFLKKSVDWKKTPYVLRFLLGS